MLLIGKIALLRMQTYNIPSSVHCGWCYHKRRFLNARAVCKCSCSYVENVLTVFTMFIVVSWLWARNATSAILLTDMSEDLRPGSRLYFVILNLKSWLMFVLCNRMRMRMREREREAQGFIIYCICEQVHLYLYSHTITCLSGNIQLFYFKLDFQPAFLL